MKRYLIFAWYHYEAYGGFNDLKDQADSLEEAKTKAKELATGYDEVEIIDSNTGKEAE